MNDGSLAPRVVARYVLIALGLIALALILWAGRDILFVLFFGVLVGVFLSTFTGPIEAKGLPRILALSLVLLAFASMAAAFWILLWPTLSEQLSTVGRDLPQAVEPVADWAEAQYRAVTGRVDQPEFEERLWNRMADQVGTILGGAMPILGSAIGAIAGLFVVLVVGIYTAASPDLYRQGFLRLIPPTKRERVDLALERSGNSLRRWMIGTVINMVLVALLVLVGLWIIGVPSAVALAVIAGLLEFIPILGPILAAVPAIAVALTVSPVTALWVTLLYVVVQQIEGDVITPVVMRGAARMPPALTVLFQSLMAVVFGFIGLLLAVPILAAVLALVETLYVEPLEADGGGRT